MLRRLTSGRSLLGLGLCSLTMLASGVAIGGHSGPAHLAQLNGRSQPAIFFVDNTGPSWPVGAAAAEWDRSSRLGVYRATGCPSSGDYCVPVYEVNTSNYDGITYSTYYPDSGHFSRSNFYINLSNQSPNTASARQSVACHEQGHALGLAHQGDGCMRSGSVYPRYPNGHDYDVLGGKYAHSN